MAGRYSIGTSALLKRQYLLEYKNWVAACVTARAEEVGNIELILYKGKGKDRVVVEEHEALDLLDRVNDGMTRHELFLATQSFKDLDGNAFWYLARDGQDGKGTIQAIYPMRPDKVTLVISKENPLQVEGYVFMQSDGQKIPLQPTEVLHHKTFNPLGYHPFPHRGMGVVEMAAWAIDTDNEARNWNYNFFKNSARPDGLLTTAGDSSMDEDEYKRLQEEWQTKHGGSDNSHKVAILGGGLKWTDISRSQKDMDFTGQRTFSRDEILSIFRVPKSIIGITDDVNRANAEASVYVFALRTVKPLMQQLVDTLNEFYLPLFGDEALKFDFKSPVTEDRKADIEEYQRGLQDGWLSINEVRKIEGLPVVEGGDTLYMPLNYQAVGTVPAEEAAPKKSIEKSEKPESQKSIAEKAIDKITKQKTVGKLPAAKKLYQIKHLSVEAKDQYIGIWKANLAKNNEPLIKKLKVYFDKQEKEVLANVRQELKGFERTEFKYKALSDFVFSEDEQVQAGISFITPFLKEYIKIAGEAAMVLIGGTKFDPNTEDLQKFVATRAQFFTESINGTTREDLLTSIKEGLDDGDSIEDIEQRVADVFDIAKGSRTMTIARTETSAASNAGSTNAYIQAGVEKVEWMVVDPKDEDCRDNEGVVVKIGDQFPSGDTEPPIHPNCECTTLPIFDDQEE